MKSIKALFVLALAVAFAVPAYAETQNVKVSGSLDAYAFNRTNYDLNKDGGSSAPSLVAATGDSKGDNYFMSMTQVEVAADLTDNVSTVINVINERDWIGSRDAAGGTTAAAEFDIDLDLAYVQMKEIFYSPLTLTVGRQDIWLGRGFIIGNNSHEWDRNGNINAQEYSVSTAFDAIRATLDFNPWTLDFIYSKITEGPSTGGLGGSVLNVEDDIDLYVANVNYKFAEYNAVAEGYFVSEWDRANRTDTTSNQKAADTETVGVRAQFDPISQITLGGELAYQFGSYPNGSSSLATFVERDRSAWAADVFGTYRWDYTWKPEITVEYVLYSGESDLSDNSAADYSSWNALYRGRFYTAYADFRQFVYVTDDTIDQSATQNQELIQVKGSMKPLEDLLLEASFTYLWNDEAVHTGATSLTPSAYLATSTRDKEIGWEIDLQTTYDYTEDVSFGLLAGWFVPGAFYDDPHSGSTSGSNATATDLVGSVKVTF